MLKYLLFICLLCVFNLNFLLAASVEIKDTSVKAGQLIKIPVYGNIDQIGSSYSFVFNYNSLQLDVKNIIGGSDLGFTEDKPSYNSKIHSFDSIDITINSSKIKSPYNGVLFYIEAEALVSSDSLSIIKPMLFKIDNNEPSNIEYKQGIVKIIGPIVNQIYPEGFGIAYPNPSREKMTVEFNIKTDSKVNFIIYNSAGAEVESYPETCGMINFEVFDNKNNQINDKNYTFKKGAYKLVLKPNSWNFSTGVYLLMMEVNGSVYKINIVYVK